MNPFIRYCRFNLVGAMGMVVQLAALAAINRCVPGHYLYATAAAIEARGLIPIQILPPAVEEGRRCVIIQGRCPWKSNNAKMRESSFWI